MAASDRAKSLHSNNSGSTPIPDPTELTANLVDKATGQLKELVIERVDGNQKLLESRLNGMDEAVKILQTITDRFPAMVKEHVGNLEKLHDEKFKSIETRILERDDQVKQSKEDAKVGIDAALASAEKLVGQANNSFKEMFNKTENATGELLKKQDENQKTESRGLASQLGTLKERIDRIEGAAVGAITAKTEVVTTQATDRGNNSFVIQVMLAAVTIGSVAFGIIQAVR